MSALVHGALSVTPPVQEANLAVIATSTSSTAYCIPLKWRDAYLSIEARGVDPDGAIYLAFGASDIVVDETAVSTLDADGGDPTFDGDEAVFLKVGTEKNFDLRNLSPSVTHFAMKASVADLGVTLTRSSGRVGLA